MSILNVIVSETIFYAALFLLLSELKIVFVGHVDHGKSTITGRFLYNTKSLPQGIVDKVQRIADETGKDFEFAYLLDAFAEERRQGITIDTTQLKFSTATRDYLIIDAPGHKEFLKNMISGAESFARFLKEFAAVESFSDLADFSNKYFFLNQFRELKFYFDYVI